MIIQLKTKLQQLNNPNIITAGGVWRIIDYPTSPSQLTVNVNGSNVNVFPSNIIGSSDNPSVNTTGLAYGNYIFSYTVIDCNGITNESELFVEHTFQVNDECAGAIGISYPLVSGGFTILNNQKLLTCATASALQTPVGVIQNPPSWYTNRSGDIWYRFTTNAAIRFKLTVTGIPNCLVAIYTTTTCNTNSYSNIHNQASVGNQIVTPELLLTAGTTYRIRLAGLPTTNFHLFSIRIDAL